MRLQNPTIAITTALVLVLAGSVPATADPVDPAQRGRPASLRAGPRAGVGSWSTSTAASSRPPPARACSSAGACSAPRSPGIRDRPDRSRLSRLPRRRPVATVTDSTNYLDAAGTARRRTGRRRGRRASRSTRAAVTPWAQTALRPAAAQARRRRHARRGEAYTYSANDMSVGDVDGDGQYEYIVKWDPSNSKDVSPGRLHRQRLHRRLRARRHAAVPHRPRRQHPRRRALHAVPRLRLRRRRPSRD